MLKKLKISLFLFTLLLVSGFRNAETRKVFDIEELFDYQKEYQSEDIGVCSASNVKTYMDYRAITNTGSEQYRFIQKYMEVDKTGLLIDPDGFIGVAMGTYYGRTGSRYYITLDTGIVLPVVMIDVKSDAHTNEIHCAALNGHVIEFVIDSYRAGDYFGVSSNGYVSSGNFNNQKYFKGYIVKVEKVLDLRKSNYVSILTESPFITDLNSSFNQGNGY